MLALETFHHVALCVTDLARAKQFYGGVLGLTELPRPDFDFPGAWYALGASQLHLIVHPSPLTLRGTTAIDFRDGHVALRVASYRDAVTHLRAHGVFCVESPHNKTPWPQVFVADPDGNLIEFNADRLD